MSSTTMMELETHVVECDLMNDSVSLAFSIQIELSSKVNASLCIVIIDKQSSLNPFKLISKKQIFRSYSVIFLFTMIRSLTNQLIVSRSMNLWRHFSCKLFKFSVDV